MPDDLGAAGLRFERDGVIGWCIIDRPEARNAFTPAMYFGIKRAVQPRQRRPRPAGHGHHRHRRRVRAGRRPRRSVRPRRRCRSPTSAPTSCRSSTIRDSRAPVVAAVNGICQAGGLLVAMVADIAVASDRATFRVPELLRGHRRRHLRRRPPGPRRHRRRPRPAAVGPPVRRRGGRPPGRDLADGAPRAAAGGCRSRRSARSCRPGRWRGCTSSGCSTIATGSSTTRRCSAHWRSSPEPREGMLAFMEKRAPNWIPEQFTGDWKHKTK